MNRRIDFPFHMNIGTISFKVLAYRASSIGQGLTYVICEEDGHESARNDTRIACLKDPVKKVDSGYLLAKGTLPHCSNGIHRH